jgi:hypothetical protein
VGLARIANAIALWICLAGCTGIAVGQGDLGGSVAGRVVGPDGSGVGGAAVRLEPADGGPRSDALSGVTGEFAFNGILPGQYTLRVRAQGLSDFEADHVSVGLGSGIRVNARLAPVSVHRTVLVEAQDTAVEDEGAARAGLEELPNNDQRSSVLAEIFGGGISGADARANFHGLSPTMNSFVLDGTDHTLAFHARERGTAGGGYAVGLSAVAVFQSGGSGPESRREAAGAVNTVTRSGSNHMHGQGVFYDRGAIGQAFNAYSRTMVEEPLGTTVANGRPVLYLNGQPVSYVEQPYHAPDRRQEWEVSAGGPIRRDRVFWFLGWEQHERHDPAVARANEPEVFFAAPSSQTLTTLEARIAGSTNPIAKSCGAGSAGISGSTAAAACAYAAVLNNLNGMLGTVLRSTRQTNVFPKITWRINDRNNLVLAYNTMRRTAPWGALSGASETDAVGSFGNSSTSDDLAMARWDYFATSHVLSSARAQWSRDVLAQTPGPTSAFEQPLAANAWGLPPEVSIDRSEGFSFGTLGTVNKREYPAEIREQFVDVWTWMRGRHALRFGYDYNYVTDTLEGINGENGAYSYATMGDFVADLLAPNSCNGTTTGTGHDPCYTLFRQRVGAPNWSFETADYAGYVADDWQATSRLKLTAGARYEYEQLPDTNAGLVNAAIPETARLPHNRDEFGPRAGLSWDIFGHGRTVLRGGYGIFFARVPNATVFSVLTSTGAARSPRAYRYRPLDEGAPAFPHIFASNETPYVDTAAPDQESTAPDAAYFDPGFRHPQIQQAEIALEQELGERTLVTLAGMATDGRRLTQFVDANIDLKATATVFYSVTAPGNAGNAGPLARASSPVNGYTNIVYAPQRFYYQRLNPAYGAMTDIVSQTNSSYRGATVRLIRRMSRNLMVNAAYTWSHTIDDGQNEATFADRNDVYDPADLDLEHGTSNYDVRQRVAGGVVVREPWRVHGPTGLLLGGYSLSTVGMWRTGLPYSMRTLGAVPTPSCSYANWLNAGGANGGANCLKQVTQPDATFIAGQAGEAVPIPSLGPSLNGSGGEDLIPPVGRNTFRYPAAVNLDLRVTKRIRLSDRYAFDLMGEAFNALNHQNVSAIQTVGYRIANDTTHANMATLTWQSGMRPGTKTVLTNGTTETQYVFDSTAAFGNPTNSNSSAAGRERQIQAGMRLVF